MPLFHRETEQERARREADEAEQEQGRAAIAAGDIPPRARRRLAELAQAGGGLFTSDLSVAELALIRNAGLRPISQVMGSSIHQVGWQLTGASWGSGAQTQQLDVVAGAYNEARRLALGRLRAEARAAGAHAVVAVRVTEGAHDWVSNAVEFVAIGTAVAIDGEQPPGDPALTDLSGQEFVKLRQAGCDPVGFVGATSAWYVVPSWQSRQRMGAGMLGGGWRNAEIPEFSQALHTARRDVLDQLHGQARELRADGVVGVKVDQRVSPREVGGEGNKRIDLRVTLHVLGTAIVEREAIAMPVKTTLPLTAARAQ